MEPTENTAPSEGQMLALEAIDATAGQPLPSMEELHAEIDEYREKANAAKVNSEDDTTYDEEVLLAAQVHGDKDNTDTWALVRSRMGLVHGQQFPSQLFTSNGRQKLAQEIDAMFLGDRDVQVINADGVMESYGALIERGGSGSFGAMSRVVGDLKARAFELGIDTNNLKMAADKFKRKRTRQLLRTAAAEYDYALRAKRSEKVLIQQMIEKMEDASRLLGGRLQPDQQTLELHELAPRVRERLATQRAKPISTGIDSFDMDCGGGVSPDTDGRLNVIAARTGVGKTTVGVATAMGLAMNGAHVLYLSPEMSAERLWPRLMSRFAYQNPRIISEGLTMDRLGTAGAGVPDGFDELNADWQTQIQKGEVGRVHVYGQHHIKPSEIIDVIFAAKSKDPAICAVFVDHFHAMRSEQGMDIWATYRQTPEELISAARSARVDIFCLAQLNRKAEETRKPDLSQIRGTDNLGMNADAAWIIARPDDDESQELNQHELICYHEKFRDAQRDKRGHRTSKKQTQLSLDRDYCVVVG